MNEWFIYLALNCVLLYTQSASQSWGGGGSLHLDDATAATGQRRQYAHHTPATGGEERVIEPIKWMGIIRRLNWQGPVVGIWPGHRGYTPSLYEKCHGIFNDHRESGPRFNVSSERQEPLYNYMIYTSQLCLDLDDRLKLNCIVPITFHVIANASVTRLWNNNQGKQ